MYLFVSQFRELSVLSGEHYPSDIKGCADSCLKEEEEEKKKKKKKRKTRVQYIGAL
jgi:hypothetical protein